MHVHVIASRPNSVAEPWRSQQTDPTDWASIVVKALILLGFSASWLNPTRAFSGNFRLGDNEMAIVAPQPRDRYAGLEAFLKANTHAFIAIKIGAAQLTLLHTWLRERLVDIVLLTIDQLHEIAGEFDTDRALRKLALINPNALIVAINEHTAICACGGWVYRAAALHVNSPIFEEGKSAGFIAAFLAIWLETNGDVGQALQAGHANAASVAKSWVPSTALLSRRQLEEWIDSKPTTAEAPGPMPVVITSSPDQTRKSSRHLIAFSAWAVAILAGFTLISAAAAGVFGAASSIPIIA